MTLTSKQRRELKAMASTRPDDLQIGKAGLSEGFVETVRKRLARQELVKLRFTELKGEERKEFGEEVAAAVEAECVAVIGRTVLLYLANPDLDPKKRVLREKEGE